MSQVLAAALAGGFVGYLLGKDERPPTEAELVNALREAKPQLFRTVQIDTSTERDNQSYPIAGQSIYVVNPEEPTQPVYIRLNEPDAPEIEVTAQRKIKAPFYRFYISNPAGAGTLQLQVNKTAATDLVESDINVNIMASTAVVDISVTGSTVMMPVDLQGAYIQMPVDIQGAYIMMPVDIQAQFMNLEIDIVAQSVGDIAIDIAAQSVGDINVNLAAQTANVNVNIAASAVTLNTHILSQEANLNINLAASAVTLDINIASQAANLDVNIAAQAANVNVNLAASAITMNVNVENAEINVNVTNSRLDVRITAATATITVTATNLSIKIDAQTVGVLTQPDWMAKEGDEFHYTGWTKISGHSIGIAIDYTVPSGKKLYITYWFVGNYGGYTSAMEGLNITGRLFNHTDSKTLAHLGGNHGAWGTFTVPLVVAANKRLILYIKNAHTAEIHQFTGVIGGYLI